MQGYFDSLASGRSMIHYTPDHYIAEDDRVVFVGTTAWTNRATGKPVETRKVDIWRFEKGQVAEFFEYYDTARLLAAASPD